MHGVHQKYIFFTSCVNAQVDVLLYGCHIQNQSLLMHALHLVGATTNLMYPFSLTGQKDSGRKGNEYNGSPELAFNNLVLPVIMHDHFYTKTSVQTMAVIKYSRETRTAHNISKTPFNGMPLIR